MKKLATFLLSSLLILTSCEDEIIDPSELVLQGTITEDKTLTKDKLWTLKGYVYVHGSDGGCGYVFTDYAS